MLLGLMRTDGGDDAAVGDLAHDRYLVVSDEDNFIRLPTPLASWPISLAKARHHMSAVSPLIR